MRHLALAGAFEIHEFQRDGEPGDDGVAVTLRAVADWLEAQTEAVPVALQVIPVEGEPWVVRLIVDTTNA